MSGSEEPGVFVPLRDVLERIETNVSIIRDKLDAKADASHVDGIDRRVSDLERRGSENAREALNQVHAVAERVTALESAAQAAEAVTETLEAIKARSSKLWIAVVGAVISPVIAVLGAHFIH